MLPSLPGKWKSFRQSLARNRKGVAMAHGLSLPERRGGRKGASNFFFGSSNPEVVQATIHLKKTASRKEGERPWSPSTLPSGRGRPWAIATPFLFLARDCRKLFHFPGREREARAIVSLPQVVQATIHLKKTAWEWERGHSVFFFNSSNSEVVQATTHLKKTAWVREGSIVFFLWVLPTHR